MQTKIIRILYLMFKLCMCIEVQNGFFYDLLFYFAYTITKKPMRINQKLL